MQAVVSGASVKSKFNVGLRNRHDNTLEFDLASNFLNRRVITIINKVVAPSNQEHYLVKLGNYLN